MKHVKITITGKVQGVSFRYTAKQKAVELGISGFVRNEPNGSVYTEAEGSDEAVEAYIQWCHEGSRKAEVEAVDVSEHSPAGHAGFTIE